MTELKDLLPASCKKKATSLLVRKGCCINRLNHSVSKEAKFISSSNNSPEMSKWSKLDSWLYLRSSQNSGGFYFVAPKETFLFRIF